MYISYKPLWHTLAERQMGKEALRLAAGLATNRIYYLKQAHPACYHTLVLTCKL